MSKLIVIIGATGGQGGSVVKTFLSDPEYRVRGVTRNPDSEKAQDLKRQGVEVVKADIGDEASLDKAFEGAYAIFAITDYYETFFPKGKDVAMDTEFQNGCNLARAASRVPTLRRYLWSTLPFTSHLTGGKVIVPHFEGKARVDQYIKESLPDLFKKATFAIFGIFSDNLLAYPIFKPVWLVSSIPIPKNAFKNANHETVGVCKEMGPILAGSSPGSLPLSRGPQGKLWGICACHYQQ